MYDAERWFNIQEPDYVESGEAAETSSPVKCENLIALVNGYALFHRKYTE